MASSLFPSRVAVLLLAVPLAMAGCTSERFTPPGEIGAAPAPDRGASEGRQLLGRVGDDGAFQASADDPLGDGTDALSTPEDRSAGAGADETVTTAQSLEPVMEPVTATQDLAGGDYTVPAEGVDMDAALGVTGAEPALATPQAPDPEQTTIVEADTPELSGTADAEAGMAPVAAQVAQPITGPVAIAEGASAQPVVDGIGTDNPVPMAPPPDEEILPPDPAITGGVARP